MTRRSPNNLWIACAVSLAIATPGAQALGSPDDSVAVEANQSARPMSEAELQEIQDALERDAARSSTADDRRQEERPSLGALIVSNLDIALILDVALAYFSNEDNLQTGAHDPRRNGFNLQQLEMSIGASVDPYFRFDSYLVFGQFGVELEEAYVTTLALPGALQMRAGQFLTRIGRINATHPHAWHFVDQPIANGKFFGGESSRGLGLELSWLAPLPWFAELLVSATEAGGECCARSFFGAEDLGVRSVGDFVYTTALKQFFPLSRDLGLMWGLSGQFGPNPTGLNNRTMIWGTDIYLRYRPVHSPHRSAVSLQIELLSRHRQVPDDALHDVGGYAQLVWSINRRWETGVRYELVTGLEDDPLDPEWTESRERATAQLTFYPSHFSRIRAQGSRDNPRWREQPDYAAFLALEVVVGAHGAHAY